MQRLWSYIWSASFQRCKTCWGKRWIFLRVCQVLLVQGCTGGKGCSDQKPTAWWPALQGGCLALSQENVCLGSQVRNKYNSKRTFKNEQLAAHKQFSEQTRQIFSKQFAWIYKKKKKKKRNKRKEKQEAFRERRHLHVCDLWPWVLTLTLRYKKRLCH